jgi:hypothetical protein
MTIQHEDARAIRAVMKGERVAKEAGFRKDSRIWGRVATAPARVAMITRTWSRGPIDSEEASREASLEIVLSGGACYSSIVVSVVILSPERIE